VQRENDFLGRIQKYRFSDVSRYDDDYYADKVMTLSDYRQWVRQQQKRQQQLGAAKDAATDTPDTKSTTQSQS
jgi:import inner membrane translocase subunit TIM23